MPNHTGMDHPWVDEHPEYYIQGTEQDLAHAPQNYTWVKRSRGDLLFAHGRDPYFSGWPDTLQLDCSNPATQEAMVGELLRIAEQCDGLRCDMAMLVLPDVFERTWGRRAPLFWPDATRRVRERVPGFCFMAEVYWDREWTMQQQGFDYAYDKRLYDRLREGHARPVREHFHAGLDYQGKLARFMENHDEPRAAASFAPGMHEAAAVIPTCRPGCGSSTRVSSKVDGSAFRRTSSARRSKQPTASCSGSTTACSPCFAIRPFATVTGGCSNRRLRGKATGRRTVSSRGSGRARPATAGSWRSTTRHSRASVTFACRRRMVVIGRRALQI